MFGHNAVRKQALGDGLHLQVQQIFPTIQGEGPLAGYPAVFIRLAGCNLRCWFCDTDFESVDATMPLEDIVAAVKKSPVETDLVVITGGEPLLQNVAPLIDRLRDDGYHVQIETAGTVWVPGAEKATLVCSPKTGELHPQILAHCEHFKYIIRRGEQSLEDGLPERSTQKRDAVRQIARPPAGATVWLQPMDEQDPDKTAGNVRACLWACYRFGYNLSYQIHKAIGVE